MYNRYFVRAQLKKVPNHTEGMLNLTFWQAIVLAIIQGVAEPFPISSVAHGVLSPYLLHWQLDQTFLQTRFLPVLVMLHLGTAIALLLYFGSEWTRIIPSLFTGDRENRRLFYLIIVGCVPAGLIGLILEKPIRHMFGDVASAAFFLILNGLLLYFGERWRQRGQKSIIDLSYAQATVVGLFQALALIPGFSRSGATMTAGFWVGLRHEEAARFSMLLATPIIFGAGLVEVPKLLHTGLGNLFAISLAGGVVAGVASFVSVWILMKWFHVNEVTAMRPFAWYCWLMGAGVLASQFLLH